MVKGSGFYLFNVQFNLYVQFFNFIFKSDEELTRDNISR